MEGKRTIIAIIGASGFIGKYVFNYLKSNLSINTYSIIGTFHSRPQNDMIKLDITDQSDIKRFLLEYQPDYVLLLAGTKDVKKCEEDFHYAFHLNTLPGYYFIRCIEGCSPATKLIFFSSDYAFNGKRGRYRDNEEPCPLTNYGRTKVSTELLLENSSVNHKIIRSSAVMGNGGLFFDWLIESLRNNADIEAYDDIYFSPTLIAPLLSGLLHVFMFYDTIDRNIIHICGDERMSRYDFAVKLKQVLHSDSHIIPVKGLEHNSLFQHDLSLVPSNIFQNFPSFMDGLRQQVFHDHVR
jgi:dTDP-4-dehydrorhamnose reductase